MNTDATVNKVVITGMGILSPIGNTLSAVESSLKAGRCGIGPLGVPGATGYKTHLAAEIRDFDPAEYMDKRQARRMDRFCQFAFAPGAGAYPPPRLAEGAFF